MASGSRAFERPRRPGADRAVAGCRTTFSFIIDPRFRRPRLLPPAGSGGCRRSRRAGVPIGRAAGDPAMKCSVCGTESKGDARMPGCGATLIVPKADRDASTGSAPGSATSAAPRGDPGPPAPAKPPPPWPPPDPPPAARRAGARRPTRPGDRAVPVPASAPLAAEPKAAPAPAPTPQSPKSRRVGPESKPARPDRWQDMKEATAAADARIWSVAPCASNASSFVLRRLLGQGAAVPRGAEPGSAKVGHGARESHGALNPASKRTWDTSSGTSTTAFSTAARTSTCWRSATRGSTIRPTT